MLELKRFGSTLLVGDIAVHQIENTFKFPSTHNSGQKTKLYSLNNNIRAINYTLVRNVIEINIIILLLLHCMVNCCGCAASYRYGLDFQTVFQKSKKKIISIDFAVGTADYLLNAVFCELESLNNINPTPP